MDDVLITARPESETSPIVIQEDYTFRTLTRGSVVVSGFGGGGIALDGMDNVYVADSYYGIVRKIDSEGKVIHVTNLGGAMRSERPWQTPLLSVVAAETLNNPRG